MILLLPVILNIKNKKILVVGGGFVSERRVKKFINAGGEITVISESFTNKLYEYHKQNKIKLISQKISEQNIEKWLKNIYLISIATDDPVLNLKIANIAKLKGILINLSQKDQISDILIPAYFEKDDILIAVSTKGKSPWLTKQLKNKIRNLISDEDILWLKVQNYAREKIIFALKDQNERERFLKSLEKNNTLKGFISQNRLKEALEVIDMLIFKLKKGKE